jgi:hypothetical protein
MCSCSKSKINFTNHELPVEDADIKWGMTEFDLIDEFSVDMTYTENKTNDGITSKKTLTIAQDIQTEYGTSTQTIFSFDETAGLFSEDNSKTVGLYQVEFNLVDTSRDELVKMIFAEYGDMDAVTDEWEGNIEVELPVEFYIPEGAKIKNLNSEAQEKIKNFMSDNVEGNYDGLTLEQEVERIMTHEDVLTIIVMGNSENESSALVFRAYYQAVLKNY